MPTLFLLFLTALGPADVDPHQEHLAREIEGELIAPCCWRAPVSEHYSPEADKVRASIRQLLAKGMSKGEVLSFYTSQYGDRILSSPPAEGFNLLSWVLPFVALSLGGVAVFLFVRRHSKPAEIASPDNASSTPEEQERYRDMLARELAE